MKALFTALSILFPLSLTAQSILFNEILGCPTDRTVTVKLICGEQSEVCVAYGTTSNALQDSTAWKQTRANEPVEVTVRELIPNQRYFYRVLCRSTTTSQLLEQPVRTFHTQRPKGTPFVFTIQADPHMDNQSDSMVYKRCLQNQLEDQPDFMVDLGDVLMSDKLKDASNKITRDTITYRAQYMRRFYEATCHSVPLFMAIGNHEGENGWVNDGKESNIAVWATQDRLAYFANPKPDDFYAGDTTSYPYVGQRNSYYSWQWGDAQFIVLDPYWNTKPKPDSLTGWRWTLGKTQYDWLRRTLESSTATFKFVFAHQLIGGDPDGRGGVEFASKYEWGGSNLDGSPGFAENRQGWYKPIKDLLQEHRVTIFFHGHDHFFAKQEKDCLIYQEVPQPSHMNFNNPGQADDYGYLEGLILPNSGHLRVSVDPNSVKVEYVRAYSAVNETSSRKNKDISATYVINANYCYDSVSTGIPIVWNADYIQEHVYPNPMIDHTTIAFDVGHSDRISITIRSVDGVLVRTLLDTTPLDKGHYAVQWDGLDSYGIPVSSGTYIYTIRSHQIPERSGSIVRVQ